MMGWFPDNYPQTTVSLKAGQWTLSGTVSTDGKKYFVSKAFTLKDDTQVTFLPAGLLEIAKGRAALPNEDWVQVQSLGDDEDNRPGFYYPELGHARIEGVKLEGPPSTPYFATSQANSITNLIDGQSNFTNSVWSSGEESK